jgi:antitoxin (DNA-binding transcriptional repressor) of toxin-antitoxin stability system
MEIFTVEEFQERFDEIIERVESGERIGIIKKDGQAAVMVPTDDDFLRIHIEHNDAP